MKRKCRDRKHLRRCRRSASARDMQEPRQSCRQRSAYTAEIVLGGVEPPRAAMPPCRPGWPGSNAIRPIETTRVHDRFVKSFQYLLTDLHQSDILQSGSAVGGVVPCPSGGQTEKNSLRANVFQVTPESGPCSMQQACLKGAIGLNRSRGSPLRRATRPTG